ncbi:hypothetical protein [Chiayiivirga flava]|uniref:FecR protein domain-containing protein n=1 Tax=Chiayiivirga flava TaxID=659595 RepID=A0A7W8FZE8_9GAMM|nr:hypothetical protein [Chiayiivirga flava]MBB5208372.1 hypothetical protein [Chiayiivirga flava]
MSLRPDSLWSPDPSANDDVARLERLLQVYRHVPAEGVVWTPVRRTPRRRWRLPVGIAAMMATAAMLLVAAWLPWRLAWSDGAAWRVSGVARIDALPVGGALATAADEHARIDVARIGSIEVSPGSRVTLLETRAGRHRIALDSGHIRARIWAPPGYFGVLGAASEVVDLGCEFDLWTSADGRGRMSVRSGWVLHSVGGQDTLVPAGYDIGFEALRAGIPRSIAASAQFGAAVDRIDVQLARGLRDADAERRVATLATAADAVTLLSLLTRYPALADGPLYPRLATLLEVPATDARHRAAWAAGSAHAIDAWWDRVPRPPKQWWRHWRDALG